MKENIEFFFILKSTTEHIIMLKCSQRTIFFETLFLWLSYNSMKETFVHFFFVAAATAALK